MDNSEILTAMGFEYVTGVMWRHPEIGFIHVRMDAEAKDIAKTIFKAGVQSSQENIKSALGL